MTAGMHDDKSRRKMWDRYDLLKCLVAQAVTYFVVLFVCTIIRYMYADEKHPAGFLQHAGTFVDNTLQFFCRAIRILWKINGRCVRYCVYCESGWQKYALSVEDVRNNCKRVGTAHTTFTKKQKK